MQKKITFNIITVEAIHMNTEKEIKKKVAAPAI